MFKKIEIINNFGVFQNFSGNHLPEFSAFNILYGWNYSGKTTLSRVFRCIETGALHPDYPNSKFKLSHQDGRVYEQDFLNRCNVRVYNEDFRKENIRWDDAEGFTPILLLGAENIEKHDELNRKEVERQALQQLLDSSKQEAIKIEEKISKAETDCARQISKELGLSRFDRRHLRPIIEKWNGVIPEPLSDSAFQAEKRRAIATEEKPTIPDLILKIVSLNEEWSVTSGLLNEQISSSGIISRLADHPEIGNWVEQGLRLHTDSTCCEFCESPLRPERMDALNAHFSDAFEDLKRRVNQAIENLQNRIIHLDGSAYPRSAFYADLEKEHNEAGAELKRQRDAFNRDVQVLIDLLEAKRENPFLTLKTPDPLHDMNALHGAVDQFRRLIKQHNERTSSFAQARSGAIDILKRHYASEAMRKVNRPLLLSQIEDLEKVSRAAKKDLRAAEQNIATLQAELSNAAKGAQAINEALIKFFGKADIQVKIADNGKFLLMRGEQVARNLSEGERTAVSFCYFVTKIFENGNNLSETIIYIDDPISSLDSHHLIHVNSYIKNTFYKFDSHTNPKHRCLAKQVFISTHNYEFFHLIWEWVSERTPNGFSASYLVERIDNNDSICSRIIECPASIKKYRSEYLFLFHQLITYSENPSNDPQTIFNLGNMARRFVEGYLAFKFLEHGKIDDSIPKLFSEPLEAERARKFMHFYSHTLKRGGGMQLPDMSEARAVIGLILESIRAQDPIHYRALQETRR